MRRGIAIGLAVAAVAASGCGGGSEKAKVPPGELVSLSRNGARPADNVSIVVRPDRHVVVTSPAGLQVTRFGPSTYRALQDDLDGAPLDRLAEEDDRKLPPAPGAYRYTISYRGRLVNWAQDAVPKELKDAFSVLSPLFASAPTPNSPLVRVRRTGGIAASRVSLRVDYGGRASRTDEGPRGQSRSYRLAPATLTRLKAAVAAVELGEVPSSNQPPPADGYLYEVSTNRRTIRAPQGGVPAPLARVIALAEGRAQAASG